MTGAREKHAIDNQHTNGIARQIDEYYTKKHLSGVAKPNLGSEADGNGIPVDLLGND